MRAITLIQPWASLILDGRKTIETRSWPSSYRGPLAIHAGVKVDREACKSFGYDYAALPRGVVLCVSEMYDCVRFPHLLVRPDDYGDFEDGRYGFLLRDVRKIVPIPARGKLGIWTVDTSQKIKFPKQ